MTNKVLDLFSGCGGFSIGFNKAGYEMIGAVDIWDKALKTLKENDATPNEKVYNKDLTEVDDDFFKQFSDANVIIAGPPCKGFSLIRVSRRNPEDERNTLFEEVVRALRIISPDLLIMENVPGLLSMDTPEGDSVKDVILKRIKKEGYNCKMTKILASDFEVPQDRERIFFIAHKNKEIDFPDIIEDKNTVKDAIGNIPNPEKDYCKEPQTEYQEKMTREDRKLYNHKGVNHSDRVIERMKYIPQGGNWRDIPEEENDLNCKYSNAYKRLNLDKPSITITNSMIIHPNENRKISVREMARLQSFPDDFVFKGSKSHQSQQIINAVPPLLAYHLAKYYKDYI